MRPLSLFGGFSISDIADSLGNITYKGVSKAVARVRGNHPELKIAKMIVEVILTTKGG